MSWLRPVDRWLINEVLPHKNAYLALARRLTGNSETARDIVQDVYAELLTSANWQSARNPKSFVLRVVYCRSMDWHDKQRVVSIQQLPDYEDFDCMDSSPNALDNLSSRDELRAVLEILTELPDRCREVVTMRRIHELPPTEIAERLGIALGTVERHLARGVSMLADRLALRGAVRRGRQEISDAEAAQNTK